MNQPTTPPTCSLRLEVRAGHIIIWPDGSERPEDDWFDPAALAASGRAAPGGTGRGSTLRFEAGGRDLLLRHYRRGGMARHLSDDRYLRVGLRRSRPWRELALLTRLHAGGMPVPAPVAARVSPGGPLSPWYRGDLITVYLEGTHTLAAALRDGALDADDWPRIGAVIGSFHRIGVDHADLNAHNILLDAAGAAYLIDFDRARLRFAGPWRRRNLARLKRSLDKLREAGSAPGFGEGAWQRLLAGYRSA